MEIRELDNGEFSAALDLADSVFDEFEAQSYTVDGVEEFHRCIRDTEFMSSLQMFGAFDGEELVGMLATRSGGTHIALFFVDGRYHRKGVGRSLFERALSECAAHKFTVNSSRYAVGIYQKLGFTPVGEEKISNGIIFTPMEYSCRSGCPCKRLKCSRHGDCAACMTYHHQSERKKLTACERVDSNQGRKRSR